MVIMNNQFELTLVIRGEFDDLDENLQDLFEGTGLDSTITTSCHVDQEVNSILVNVIRSLHCFA